MDRLWPVLMMLGIIVANLSALKAPLVERLNAFSSIVCLGAVSQGAG
jgi:NADH:ubiquinone oxidoreductase subunit 2 (subunit N)